MHFGNSCSDQTEETVVSGGLIFVCWVRFKIGKPTLACCKYVLWC